MNSVELAMTLLLGLGQTGSTAAVKVRLADVVADPSRYDGVVIEVTAETEEFVEHGLYLCAKACDDRDSGGIDKRVRIFLKEGFSDDEWKTFERARRAARYVRARFTGRFEAADEPRWGYFRFRLVASRIQNVEVSELPFKR